MQNSSFSLLLLFSALAMAAAFDLHSVSPSVEKSSGQQQSAATGPVTVPTTSLHALGGRRGRRVGGAALLKALMDVDASCSASPLMTSSSFQAGDGGEDFGKVWARQPLLAASSSALLNRGQLLRAAGQKDEPPKDDKDDEKKKEEEEEEPRRGEGEDTGAMASLPHWGRVANISLGTPPRPHLLYLAMDQPWFWVLQRGLQLDPRLLSRPRQLYRDDLSHTSDITGPILPIFYGMGHVMVARDTVSMGSASVKNVSFGAAIHMHAMLKDDEQLGLGVDGVFGLGLSNMSKVVPSPVHSVISQLPQPMFTLYQRQTGYNLTYTEERPSLTALEVDGALTLGGENLVDCAPGTYQYANYTVNRRANFAPEVAYRGIQIGGVKGPNPTKIPSPPRRAGFMDGLGVYLRASEARAIADHVGARPFSEGGGLFEVDCNRTTSLPPITIQLGDESGAVDLRFDNYTVTIEDHCLLLFMGVHSSQKMPVMIGYDTLQGKCMANRVVEKRLGFAPQRAVAARAPAA